jgi:hypothetical protein
VKFLAESRTGGYDKILDYSDILDYIKRGTNTNTETDPDLTGFKDNIGHQGQCDPR